MRRLEEVLHDLAEQDERLPTSELITRIERHLAGESDFPVVVIDGRSEMDTHKSTRQTRRWAPALVAAGAALLVLLAVGLPILFFNGGESIVADQPATTAPPSATTVSPTTVAPTTVEPFSSSGLVVLDVPLSEVVPGFTDTIVMFTNPRESFNVMRLRPSEPMTELVLSLDRDEFGSRGGWPVGLDISGNWFAAILDDGVLTVHPVPDQAGQSSEGEIVGLQVESVAWHATEPGRLAWLACPQGQAAAATLFTFDIADETAEPVPIRSFEQGCMGDVRSDRWDSEGVWLLRWGSEGALLNIFGEDTSELILVDAGGIEIPIEFGSFLLAVGPDGTSIWRDDPGYGKGSPFLLSADGQERIPVPGLADDDWLLGASWSPDSTHLVLILKRGYEASSSGLRVVDAATGAIIEEVAERDSRVIATAWSANGRFLVYESWNHAADSGTLVFYDTTTGATTSTPLAEIADEIRVQ